MTQAARRLRKIKIGLAALMVGTTPLLNGCWDSDIAKRFREAAGPGAVAGASSALTNPSEAEAGLRDIGAALFAGLGAIFAPRTPSSAGG